MLTQSKSDHLGPLLLQPITFRGVTARNRIVVSPMSQYAAIDAAPTDWHLVHLGKFAMGGAGIVFVEETAVEERARKTYHCPGIYNDTQAKAWRRVTDFLRSQGALERDAVGSRRPQGCDQVAVGGFRAADPGGCRQRASRRGKASRRVPSRSSQAPWSRTKWIATTSGR